MNLRLVVLPGDGIGPEVIREAQRVLDAVVKRFGHTVQYDEHLFGGVSYDRYGAPLTEKTLAACAAADAVLLGAVGGPKWDLLPREVRPEQGLLALRKKLGLFANLRPVRVHPALLDASSLKPAVIRDVDLVVIRELTGGLYFGEPRFTREEGGITRSVDTLAYTSEEIRRVADLAFRIARGRRKHLTLVDKANVLETSRLWRKVVPEVHAAYPEVTLENMFVDSAAMRLVTAPSKFDVLLTENMFGDILTDEAATIVGSMGMLPSASLGSSGPGVFEPIHGSAPDITGRGIANPAGAILSVAMLLRLSFGLEREAMMIEEAVGAAWDAGFRTKDLGGECTTVQLGSEIAGYVAETHVGVS
jgi:3-isopropylmalate dehydrogenase